MKTLPIVYDIEYWDEGIFERIRVYHPYVLFAFQLFEQFKKYKPILRAHLYEENSNSF